MSTHDVSCCVCCPECAGASCRAVSSLVQLKVLTLDVDLLKPSAQRAGDSNPRHADRALEVRGVIHSGCSIVESGVESGVGGGGGTWRLCMGVVGSTTGAWQDDKVCLRPSGTSLGSYRVGWDASMGEGKIWCL